MPSPSVLAAAPSGPSVISGVWPRPLSEEDTAKALWTAAALEGYNFY